MARRTEGGTSSRETTARTYAYRRRGLVLAIARESAQCAVENTVRLLTPFDPVVWDRERFEMFWGWQYRFEAYVPAAKRRLGYYALPLLWRDRVLGWANLQMKDEQLK